MRDYAIVITVATTAAFCKVSVLRVFILAAPFRLEMQCFPQHDNRRCAQFEIRVCVKLCLCVMCSSIVALSGLAIGRLHYGVCVCVYKYRASREFPNRKLLGLINA